MASTRQDSVASKIQSNLFKWDDWTVYISPCGLFVKFFSNLLIFWNFLRIDFKTKSAIRCRLLVCVHQSWFDGLRIRVQITGIITTLWSLRSLGKNKQTNASQHRLSLAVLLNSLSKLVRFLNLWQAMIIRPALGICARRPAAAAAATRQCTRRSSNTSASCPCVCVCVCVQIRVLFHSDTAVRDVVGLSSDTRRCDRLPTPAAAARSQSVSPFWFCPPALRRKPLPDGWSRVTMTANRWMTKWLTSTTCENRRRHRR